MIVLPINDRHQQQQHDEADWERKLSVWRHQVAMRASERKIAGSWRPTALVESVETDWLCLPARLGRREHLQSLRCKSVERLRGQTSFHNESGCLFWFRARLKSRLLLVTVAIQKSPFDERQNKHKTLNWRYLIIGSF